MNIKKKQIFELIFVPAFAFLPSIIFSFLAFFKNTERLNYQDLSASFLFAIIYQCLSLSLLYYVLHRRYETFKDLGISYSWQQLFSGIGLTISALAFTYIMKWILIKTLPITYLHYLYPKNLDFIPKDFSLLFFTFLIINPFKEELIVRGFVMREILSLKNSKILAIVISVLIQVSYHLYQGLLPALVLAIIFSTYSIYYAKTGKLTPVIISHLMIDLISISTFIYRH